MKTNQVLIRKMGSFDVAQRTSDAMFNATELLKQWNETSGQQKNIGQYFAQDSTSEFIVALSNEYGIDSEDFAKGRNSAKNSLSGIYTKSRGINGGTWMEPILFIDFAMWLNPSFKVKVLKFVYDELIKYRNDSGDAYREMAFSITKIVSAPFMSQAMQTIAKAINYIIYGRHESEIRNTEADESKLRDLYEIERDITKLINGGFIRNFDSLMNFLRREYTNRRVPKVLQPCTK